MLMLGIKSSMQHNVACINPYDDDVVMMMVYDYVSTARLYYNNTLDRHCSHQAPPGSVDCEIDFCIKAL